MRISDWSSDVCSSDLLGQPGRRGPGTPVRLRARSRRAAGWRRLQTRPGRGAGGGAVHLDRSGRREQDRKSVVEGKGVSVRVDLGGRRIIKKKNITPQYRKHDL